MRSVVASMFVVGRIAAVVAGCAAVFSVATAVDAQVPPGSVVPGGAPKQAVREPQTGEDAVKVSAAAVGDAKAGATVRVAVTFDVIPGWHIYWLNAGESGAPTDLELVLPEGCSMATRPNGRPVIDYPTPKVFRKSDTTFGYEGSVTLSVEVKLPSVLPAGGLPVTVRSSWLVCKERCLLGRNEATVDLAKPVAADSKQAKALAESVAALPKALPADWKVRLADVSAEAAILELEAPASLAADAAGMMLPADTPGIFLESGYLAEANGRFLRVPLVLSRELTEGQPLVFAGIIVLGKNAGSFAFSLPMPAP